MILSDKSGNTIPLRLRDVNDFRRDNLEAIRRVCREFTLVCKKLELFGGELVAIDGGKFRAVNSRKRDFNPAKLARIIESLDERITAYLAEMEQQDAAEPPAARTSVEELRVEIEQIKGRKQLHEDLALRLRESGARELPLTDPDSRLMSAGQGLDVCYDVQTAVDSKHKLIVHHEVTDAHTDEGWLAPMAAAARRALGAGTLEAVADKGYYSGAENKRCEEEGIVTYIPKAHVSPELKKKSLTKDDFRYDPATDTYTCPEGARLTHRFTTPESNGVKQRYYRTTAC